MIIVPYVCSSATGIRKSLYRVKIDQSSLIIIICIFFLHNKVQQMCFLLMSEKWSSRNDLRFPLRNYFSQQLLTCLVSFPLECCLYVNVALVILSETALSNAVCASFDPMYSAYFCSRVFFGSDWLRQFYLIRCHPDLTS
jgi:hypothetical protein